MWVGLSITEREAGDGGQQEQRTCKTLFKDDLYNFRRINEGKKGFVGNFLRAFFFIIF